MRPAPGPDAAAYDEAPQNKSPAAATAEQATTINGPLLVVVAGAVILSAGAGASWWVVRRFRREASESPLPEPSPVGAPVESLPEDGRGAVVDGPAPVTEGAPRPDIGRNHSTRTSSEPARSGSWQLPTAGGAGWERHELSSRADAVSVHEARAPTESSTISLFDRRRAERLPFTRSATVEWADRDFEVTTRDMNEEGVGCEMRMTTDGRQHEDWPSLRARVHVVLLYDGKTLRLPAQVRWRRATASSVELGMKFLGLSDSQLEPLRAVVAHARGESSGSA